jgi:hypothetical protein
MAENLPVPSAATVGPVLFRQWKRSLPLFTRKNRYMEIAAQQGRADIMRYLIGQGADCRHMLIRMARHNDAKGLKTLIDAGFDVNCRAGQDNALSTAARHDSVACLKLLIEAGADADQRGGPLKFTPLARAAYYDCEGAVRLLIAAGADPTLRNNDGGVAKTACKIAGEENNFGCHDLLAAYEQEWERRKKSPAPLAALPAPKAETTGHVETAVPAGWSVIDRDGIEMAVQGIDDPASGVSIRNVYDFKGARLLTQFQTASSGPVSASDKGFAEVKPELVSEARRIFEAARNRPGKAGLI